MSKRPIDRIREAALSMQIGDYEDGAILTMIEIDNALYAVKEHAIYEVRLADQVDPERTNVAVPNTQQRVLAKGANDPEVARIFLTACKLFKATHLGAAFPEHKARSLAFEYLRDIVALMEIHSTLMMAIDEAVAGFEAVAARDRSVVLPSLENAQERCDAFAQKVGHAIDTLRTVAQLFYPKELSKKWIDSLTVVAAQKHGDDAGLGRFMKVKGRSLLFMREMRNMTEHPQVNAYVKVSDFQLLPSMELAPPSVEFVMVGQPPVKGQIASFMGQIVEELVSIAEVLFALLCDANIEASSGFEVVVVDLPPDRRPTWNPHQRFSYGMVMDGKVHPFG